MPVDRLLVFTLGASRFALRLGEVAGVMEPAGIRRIPDAAGPVLGLCEWRGRILTVLDLPRLLGAEPSAGLGSLIRLRPPFQRTAFWIPVSVAIGTGILEEEEEEEEEAESRPPERGPQPRLLETPALLAAAAAEVRDRTRTEPRCGPSW
jgi:hypothetical protein